LAFPRAVFQEVHPPKSWMHFFHPTSKLHIQSTLISNFTTITTLGDLYKSWNSSSC
jgi:hypothetical protein